MGDEADAGIDVVEFTVVVTLDTMNGDNKMGANTSKNLEGGEDAVL